MRAHKSRDGRIRILVRGDADFVLPRLRGPVRHSERRGYKWHGSAVADRPGAGAKQYVHLIDGTLLSASRRIPWKCHEGQKRCPERSLPKRAAKVTYSFTHPSFDLHPIFLQRTKNGVFSKSHRLLLPCVCARAELTVAARNGRGVCWGHPVTDLLTPRIASFAERIGLSEVQINRIAYEEQSSFR